MVRAHEALPAHIWRQPSRALRERDPAEEVRLGGAEEQHLFGSVHARQDQVLHQLFVESDFYFRRLWQFLRPK